MNDIEILEEMIKDAKEFEKQFNTAEIEQGTEGQKRIQAIENLIQRNKDLEQIEQEHKEENGRLRDRINKTINKLDEDILDDICMWVNNQKKIVTTAKAIIDRSAYAKEILELLEEDIKE